jgi:copper homeostasis protein
MPIEIEICCFSLASALVANEIKANRVELCGGFLEGGTTPSHGLIKIILESIDSDVYVMIRPRGGDFCYWPTEIDIIKEDILSIKTLNPKGFVFGALKPNGEIDLELCEKVIDWAAPFPVTFHRAFDQCFDFKNSLEQIIDLGFERILTSGQESNVSEGLSKLKELTEMAGDRIQIMAGAGVNAGNIEELANAGLKAVHFTGKEWVKSPMAFASKVRMQADVLPDDLGKYETSLNKAKEMAEILNTFTQT